MTPDPATVNDAGSRVDKVQRVGQTEAGRLRVLVSAGTVGGPGGAQRALSSILRACARDHVDVVARKVVGPLADDAAAPRHLWGRQHWRWVGSKSTIGRNGAIASVLNPLRARVLPSYDVHIRLFQGVELNAAVRARLRLLVPSGNFIESNTAEPFDYVAMQAPDNAAFVPEGVASTLLPPPLYPLSAQSRQPAVPLPPEFYLTVFNPYGPIKGTDDLERAVEQSRLPIVWCHSDKGVVNHVPQGLRDHPRVVHVSDPSEAELRWLYEHCAAYLCFSRTEGFGWSIADGLRHTPVIVSRDIGILTHPAARELPGVVRVDADWRVDWTALPVERGVLPDRDLSFQSPEAFRQSLVELVSGAL